MERLLGISMFVTDSKKPKIMHQFTKTLSLVFFVSLGLMLACSKPPCEVNGDVQLNASFYRNVNNSVKDTLVDSVALVLGLQLDTVYFETNKTKSLSFPLNINSDTTTVVVTFDQKVSDTITFVVKRDLKMISHECGFAYYFEIQKVESTTNRIKSIWVSKELVEYGTKENIKIYL
jgi:hypothetical protein